MDKRLDYAIIANYIKADSKVLDVGCGDASLLDFLKKEKNVQGRGIELLNKNVALALKKGISVIQGDADNDLKDYPSNSVDYVILSQTLQATKYPAEILNEMQRIAKFSIVSVPNFGYIKNRLYFALLGKMPVTKDLSFQWYDTPNIHFCTIKDFTILANDLNFNIKEHKYINTELPFIKELNCNFIGNIMAKYGIFLLERGKTIKNKKKTFSKNKISFPAQENFAHTINE
jgi:methionine biosynthesis protein MetW